MNLGWFLCISLILRMKFRKCEKIWRKNKEKWEGEGGVLCNLVVRHYNVRYYHRCGCIHPANFWKTINCPRCKGSADKQASLVSVSPFCKTWVSSELSFSSVLYRADSTACSLKLCFSKRCCHPFSVPQLIHTTSSKIQKQNTSVMQEESPITFFPIAH